jgi:hypothetical protein
MSSTTDLLDIIHPSYSKQIFGKWTVSASSGKKLISWEILVCLKMDLSSTENEARQYPHAHLADFIDL